MIRRLNAFLAVLGFITISGALAAADKGDSSVSRDQALSTCESRLSKILYLPLDKMKGAELNYPLNRISEKNPLTHPFAKDYHLLIADLPAHLSSLPPETQTVCLDLGHKLEAQLTSFFTRRFALLQSSENLDVFYQEFQTVLAYWGLVAERRMLVERFHEATANYLELSMRALKRDLVGTPWENYTGFEPTLETWNDEWTQVLGSEAPGAVLYYAQRIAIQATELDPLSLKIVLFHELSHLADPMLLTDEGRAGITRESAEVFAWGETVKFLLSLKARGVVLPPRFESRLALISEYGLKAWVKAVIGK